MALIDFSTTPGNNNAAPPNGAPEGMSAALVNDTIRQIMADVKGGVSLTVATKALMSVLDAAKLSEGNLVRMTSRTIAGDSGGGIFRVTKTNISVDVTADTQQGFFVPFDSDATGASGGFIRNDKHIIPHMFGANGVGLVDDTVAILAADAFVKANKFSALNFPEGTYLITKLVYGNQTANERHNWVGAGKNRTQFIKNDVALEPMLEINKGATFFTGEIRMSGFRMRGQIATTTACIESEGLANCHFEDIWVENSVLGWQDNGAISCTWDACIFNANGKGMTVTGATSAIPGVAGDPNANWMNNCIFTNNTTRGFEFNDGRLFVLYGGRCEGNGTVDLAESDGGVFIGKAAGSRIDVENSTGVTRVGFAAITGFGKAVVVDGMWFENNRGRADVWAEGGGNVVNNCTFRSAAVQTTHDIRASFGTIQMDNNTHSVPKTDIVKIEDTINPGNSITRARLPQTTTSLNYPVDKTTVFGIQEMMSETVLMRAKITISGADNTVAIDTGSGNFGVTSVVRTSVGKFLVTPSQTYVLSKLPHIEITGKSSTGAAFPSMWFYGAEGTAGGFTLEFRRSDGAASPLFDPTTDGINRSCSFRVWA